MAVPPPPPADLIRADPVQFLVLLGTEGGDWPTLADEVDYLVPVRFHRSISGHRIDSITFRWDLDLSGDRLVDTTTPVGYDRVVDLHVYNPVDGSTRRVAWGKISEQSHQFDQSSESVTVTARVEAWLIGEYRTSGHYVRHTDGSKQLVDRPIVFNPEIDGRLQGNRSSVKVSTFPGIEDVSVWIAPESTMTAAARTEQGALDRLWTLADAVHTLCNMLNPDETFCRNPDIADLQSLFTLTDVDDFELLRAHSVSPNLWLGQALDQLLEPYGFAWYLEIDDAVPTVGTDKQHSRISFMKRNDGPSVDVFATRPTNPKTPVDRDNLNIASFHASISIAELVNEVNAVTDPVQIESTWDLIPEWPESKDSDLDVDELYGDRKRIQGDDGLLWVLNEAGDLNNGRTGITTSTSLDSLLEESHPDDGSRLLTVRRRRFGPALTRGNDGAPLGVRGFELQFQEKYTQTFNDDPPIPDVVQTREWRTVDWPFEVLDDQCGIRLTGKIDPGLLQQVVEFPDHVHLRMTATIESDYGRRVQAEKRAESPNGETVRLEANLPRRFRVRKVSADSRWYDDRHEDVTGIAVNASDSVVTIAGDHSELITEGSRIAITGSTSNDGVYTASAVSAGSSTDITVDVVLDGTADGTVGWLTDEVDDTKKLQEYVEHLRDIDDAADFPVSVTLHGCDHTEYEIGKLVASVDGRNLTLNANAPSQPARLPQIIGYNVELSGEQTMELVLESFRLERFDFSREP